MFEGILFYRLLDSLISDLCVQECSGVVYEIKHTAPLIFGNIFEWKTCWSPREMWPFLTSSMVLGILVSIFWQMYLIKLLRLLTDLRSSRPVAFDMFKTFVRVWHADLFHHTELNLMKFQVSVLALFLHFSIIDSFRCLWGNFERVSR